MNQPPWRAGGLAGLLLAALLAADQPKVQPGPSEPDWIALLDRLYGLRMIEDLENPVRTTVDAVPGTFRRAGPGPVTFRPVLALGLEVPIRGGYYRPGSGPEGETELWSYRFKSTGRDIESGADLTPPLSPGSVVAFDPGDEPFGVWVGNDQFQDRVFGEPARVRARTPRLSAQPYKAMIYRAKDRESGRVVPGRYLIGWEYSTNDDFQDVVCLLENVVLVP